MLSYFFLLSLFKSDEPLIISGQKISEEYKKSRLPQFGVKKHSNTSGYGYGEQEKLIYDLVEFSSKFPNCIFGFYHFYWNCKCLTIYTINKGKVFIDKTDLGKLYTGPYNVSTKFSFKNTQIPNNITCYLNEYYHQPFEKTFKLKPVE